MSVCRLSSATVNNTCNIIFSDGSVAPLREQCQRCYGTDGYFSNPSKWQKNGECYTLLNQIPTTDINYVYLKVFMQDIFKQYYDNNCRIVSNIDSLNYNPVQQELYNSCRTFDNVCQFGLGGNPWIINSFNYCQKPDVIPSVSVLNTNPQLAYFCSCYLNPISYIPTIPIECDSLCGLTQSIKLYDIDNNKIQCQNNVCSISDITLNITESTTGEINFQQVCGGVCGEVSCSKCFLNNINVDILNSKTGDIRFTQNCGGTNDATAFECWESKNGKYVAVPCSESTGGNAINNIDTKYLIYIILSSIVFLIIIIMFLYLIVKNKNVKF